MCFLLFGVLYYICSCRLVLNNASLSLYTTTGQGRSRAQLGAGEARSFPVPHGLVGRRLRQFAGFARCGVVCAGKISEKRKTALHRVPDCLHIARAPIGLLVQPDRESCVGYPSGVGVPRMERADMSPLSVFCIRGFGLARVSCGVSGIIVGPAVRVTVFDEVTCRASSRRTPHCQVVPHSLLVNKRCNDMDR